ncbi:hypothetical protein JJE63_05920 [Alloprevotella tannerae]|uniref:hypothetical protein n=1 Tax=Alloprevotella tannerae TaxID=76122 RepID=UPI001EDC8BCA|nr:hypothetical protein [Alloprevotella tannerae]MCG2652860.1 hypothetical protein [Alloprevotella tannerae]
MAAEKKRMMAGERSNVTSKRRVTVNEKKYHDGKGEFGSKRKKCSRRWEEGDGGKEEAGSRRKECHDEREECHSGQEEGCGEREGCRNG